MTGAPVAAVWAADSRRPAARLPSQAAMLVEGAWLPTAMVQYPATALWTELWKAVGDTAVWVQ